MTLQLHKLAQAIRDVGRALAGRLSEREGRLPQVIDALHRAAQQDDLAERLDRAQRRGWFGAATAGEMIDHIQHAPPTRSRVTVVATDGSQIYPDRHTVLPYYALNVGFFIVRLGTGQSRADSQPEIVTDPERLFHRGEPINAPTLNARRKVDEMLCLADLCLDEAIADEGSQAQPVVGLIDGSLALRVRNEAIPGEEQRQLEGQFLAAMESVGEARIPVAGYIARPGGSPLLALLALAMQPADNLEAYLVEFAGPSRPASLPTPFRDLSDAELFARILPSGARSAVFEFVAEWNHVYQKALVKDGSGHSHSSHFFYLNVGRSNPVVARVEVPQWVVAHPASLDLVHGAIVEQAWVTLDDPYPYALARADEEAVIRAPEKEQVERMLAQSLLAAGLHPSLSEKQAHKQRARYRR